MKQNFLFLLICVFLFGIITTSCTNQPTTEQTVISQGPIEEKEVEEEPAMEPSEPITQTITLLSADSLTVKADIYEGTNPELPLLLLFHQADFSRGEYVQTAPQFAELGFTCIAIDQRSGKEVNGVINETYKQAVAKGLGINYPDAYPDLETALNYAKENYPGKEIILCGSSYSSSMVFILASRQPENIVGLMSFSPGEYYEFDGKKIEDYAKQVKIPVFVTSAKSEEKLWRSIFDVIETDTKVSFLPENVEGIHGTRALWSQIEGNEQYWKAVNDFLQQFM